MLKELIEKRKELDEKSKLLAKVFEEAKAEDGKLDFMKVKCLGADMTSIKVAEKVGQMNNELTAIGKDVDTLEAAEQAEADLKARALKAGNGGGIRHDDPNKGKPEQKTFGQMFVESEAYKNRNSRAFAEIAMDRKTLFQRTAGWAPESVRSGVVVPFATRPVQVMDLIPALQTSQAAYKYMEETTFTNNATEKAEGSTFGEAALVLTERTVVVEKLPVWIPVTDEQLDDVAGIQGYLDSRLQFMIMQRLDSQILNGNGSTPNVQGILNIGGSLQTQAKGTDDVPTAIRKAMTKVRVTGRAIPSAVVLHPNDWQDIRTLKTTDGIFIWGPPSEQGPERIWGRPISETDAIAENTGLVGDFVNFSNIVERQAMDVQVGFVNDDFVKGKKAIRATIRVALVWTRPAAFCTVTSI
jgi:HK97 family phage major capsid protein